MDGFYTIKQAAELLGVERQWLYERCRLNRLPHYRFGALIRFDKQELNEWIKAQRSDGTGPVPVGAR